MAVVNGTIYRKDTFTQTVSSGVVSSYSIDVAPAIQSVNYTNGTSASQVDLLYGKQLSITTTPTDLDLTTLTDPPGGAVNFARVRELIIENLSTTAGQNLVVSGGASNQWTGFLNSTGTLTLPPGAKLRISDPTSVTTAGGITSGTSKTLRLVASTGTISANVTLVGGSTQGA